MRRWFVISIVANIALVVALVVLLRFMTSARQAATAGVVRDVPGQDSSATLAASSNKAPRVVTVTNMLEAGFDWRQVESADYREYIANLRSIGCPEATIRDIIIADVDKLFEDRRKAIRSSNTNKFEYWKGGMEMMFEQMMDEKKLEQNQALAMERRNLLTQLLGSPPEEKLNVVGMMTGGLDINQLFSEMLDFLTPAQQTQVMELEQKYEARRMKATATGGELNIEKERQAELAKLLTPDELEAYQLRMSDTADRLRNQLKSFGASEREFVEIFRAKRVFEDEFGNTGRPQDKEGQARYDIAQREMTETLQSKLGNRYADYERAQHPGYNALYRVAQRHGVSKEATIAVDDMRRIAEEKMLSVRYNARSPEEMNAALQAIADETTRSVQQALGDDAFKSFQKNRTASGWLNNLAPKQPTAAP